MALVFRILICPILESKSESSPSDLAALSAPHWADRESKSKPNHLHVDSRLAWYSAENCQRRDQWSLTTLFHRTIDYHRRQDLGCFLHKEETKHNNLKYQRTYCMYVCSLTKQYLQYVSTLCRFHVPPAVCRLWACVHCHTDPIYETPNL